MYWKLYHLQKQNFSMLAAPPKSLLDTTVNGPATAQSTLNPSQIRAEDKVSLQSV